MINEFVFQTADQVANANRTEFDMLRDYLTRRINSIIDEYEGKLTAVAKQQPSSNLPNWFQGPQSTWKRHGLTGLATRLFKGQSALGESTLEAYNKLVEEIMIEEDIIFENTGIPQIDSIIGEFKTKVAKTIANAIMGCRKLLVKKGKLNEKV
jgi:hypothetical protein